MSRIAAGRRVRPQDFAPLEALIFDMGDVLYDATLWRRWLWQSLVRTGLSLSYNELFAIWDGEYLHEVHRGHRRYAEAQESFLFRLGLSRGLIDELEAASQAKRRELETGLRPLRGVKPTLHRLQAAGFSLAVLSDSESPARELRERLDRLEIGSCFASIVSSCEIGAVKPERRCYEAALAAIDARADRAAFVGHDAEELAGAQAAGLTSIAVNHDAGAPADWHLERFEQLQELLPVAARGIGLLS